MTSHLLRWLPLLCAPLMVAAEMPKQENLVRITPERIPMDPQMATLCRPLDAIVGVHQSASIHLYVNQAVIDYRKQHPNEFRYPIGSVFFKEKYDADGKTTIATVMTKVADTQQVSDWRFEMFDLSLRAPAKIDLASCTRCHNGYAERGFISSKTTITLAKYLKSPTAPPSLTPPR